MTAPADDIVRTTSPRHKLAVQEIWRRMAANGDIYLSKYSGWYSVRDEAYYDKDEIEERDGRKFAVKSGAPVEWVEEESYFFRLSAYAERLLAHYEKHPEFVTPENYRNEIVAFVKRGLKDLSISRTTFDWGIPVPDDPRHVMYVWVDALTNYITATGFPDPHAPRAQFLAGRCPCHRQGHHPLSRHLLAGLSDVGETAGAASRSSCTASCSAAARKCRNRWAMWWRPPIWWRDYGVDQLRYFFLREVPFGQDGNYSHEAIVARINADLANDLGNLAQRSLSMIAKNCDGKVPDLRRSSAMPTRKSSPAPMRSSPKCRDPA